MEVYKTSNIFIINSGNPKKIIIEYFQYLKEFQKPIGTYIGGILKHKTFLNIWNLNFLWTVTVRTMHHWYENTVRAYKALNIFTAAIYYLDFSRKVASRPDHTQHYKISLRRFSDGILENFPYIYIQGGLYTFGAKMKI